MNRNKSLDRINYRPRYHFRPESNWLNDPNGLVYYEGEYHLFYQHNPNKPLWGSTHWGHAVSKDLIHWDHLPIALKPDELGYIFSGSVVIDKHDTSGLFDGESGLVAIYTNAREKGGGDYLQRQSIAFSKDQGRSWTKYGDNPVLENPGLANFRDPDVFWHDPTNKWIMVVSSQSHARLYGSSDLKDWTYLSEFGEEFGSHEGAWECPELFKLSLKNNQERWVLAVGDVFGGKAGGSRVQYFVGKFDGVEFTPDNSSGEISWVDYGQDFYAARRWNYLPGNRNVWIGWLNNLNYMESIPSGGWRGTMSIPRELGLKRDSGNIYLTQQPISELKNLREESWSWKELKVSHKEDFLPQIRDSSLEVEIEAKPRGSRQFGIKFRKSDDKETVVGYSTENRKLFVDRSKSGKTDFSEDFLGRHEAPLEPVNGKIRLHIFIDRSSIEVFGNDGKRVISNLIFPDREGEATEFFVNSGEVEVSSLQIYKLHSIWK